MLAIVLAGGEGKRLSPLTADRAKPAVPFGGNYRLVDFVLSNMVNAGYRQVVVLTQYKSHSLDRHIARTWAMTPMLGQYVATVPAQMRKGPRWFSGSADAIFQNLNLIEDERPDHVLVFGADHIYRMDPRQMVAAHEASGAAVTVAAIRVPREQSEQFGVIQPGADGRIAEFVEKPADPPGLPDAPDEILASMGNYVFSTLALCEAITEDAANTASKHDLGGDVIPMMVERGQAAVYDFSTNVVPGETARDHGYWRDVGTIDAYYDAHMDLVSVHPIFNLYNRAWPIHAASDSLPPAKFVFDDEDRRGMAVNSVVGAGTVISGGTVRRSVLAPSVVVHTHATVEDSVVLSGVDIGRGSVVRRAILDKNVRVDPGAQIGVDLDLDRRRFTVSANGIVVVGKGERVTE